MQRCFPRGRKTASLGLGERKILDSNSQPPNWLVDDRQTGSNRRNPASIPDDYDN